MKVSARLIWEFLNTDLYPHHVDGFRRCMIARFRDKTGKCPDPKIVSWYLCRVYELVFVIAMVVYFSVAMITVHTANAVIIQMEEYRSRTSDVSGSTPTHGFPEKSELQLVKEIKDR